MKAKPLFYMAEGVGFEPTVPCGTTDFESVTFDLSDTPPWVSSSGAGSLYKVFRDFFPALNSLKKPLSSSEHSAPSTPSSTATLWLKRSSCEKS